MRKRRVAFAVGAVLVVGLAAAIVLTSMGGPEEAAEAEATPSVAVAEAEARQAAAETPAQSAEAAAETPTASATDVQATEAAEAVSAREEPPPPPDDTPAPEPDDPPQPPPADTPAPEPDDSPQPPPADTPAPEPDDPPQSQPEDTPAPEPDDSPQPPPADTPAPEPDDSPQPPPADTPAPEPDESPQSQPEDTPEGQGIASFGDGEFVVGVDVPPGLYRTFSASEACEWERRSADGLTGFGDSTFPITIVEIAPSEVGFTSQGCGIWSSDPGPVVTPGQPFGEGAFFVGAEVAPGRYRAIEPSESCRWYQLWGFAERYGRDLRGFGGQRPNSGARGDDTVVDISDRSVAFVSAGCGTWSNELSPVATPGQPFPDGTYIVGIDVAPGRYRPSTPESCSWRRMFTFGGEHSYGHGPWYYRPGIGSVADIEPSDAGFRSHGCGTWSDVLDPIATPGEPFTDGIYLVGIDIAPGRYRAVGLSESCRWYRRASFGGMHSDGYESPLGYGRASVVDIAATDAGFETSGCGTWTSVLTPIATPGQPFGDGDYIVGPEVAPGRYFAYPPSGDCRWYRLEDFGGRGFGELGIGDGRAWSLPTRLAIVDIAASDAGFISDGCGTWTMTLIPRAAPGEAPADGMWFVGLEITPGRYRATTGASCSWRRLGAFGGGHDDEIGYTYSNEHYRHLIVDIAASDAGFYSKGCSWTADLTPLVDAGQPFGDGTYVVGTEVAPGRYRATSFSDRCFWKRLVNFGGLGGPDAGIIAARWSGSGGAIVDIAPSDVGFHSWGCGIWTTDLAHPDGIRQSFGDGTFLVGSDMQPGRYRALPSTTRCVWERLRGFGGTDEEVVGRGSLSGSSFIVEIAPTDVGFYTDARCGAWQLDTIPRLSPGQPFGGGVYHVGSEIAPGRYRIASLDGLDGFCWWARLSGFGGTTEEYLGWYNAKWYSHSAIVDISSSDTGFASSRCGAWTTAGEPLIAPGDAIPGGAFLVGEEIAPGRYQQTTPSTSREYSCEWKRVSGFGGSEAEAIEAGSAPMDAMATVDIAATDVGFISHWCGPWTRAP